MGVFVLISKYILWCCYHFTVWGTSFHFDNFYKTTLHICSQETAFCCFYGRIAVPPCICVDKQSGGFKISSQYFTKLLSIPRHRAYQSIPNISSDHSSNRHWNFVPCYEYFSSTAGLALVSWMDSSYHTEHMCLHTLTTWFFLISFRRESLTAVLVRTRVFTGKFWLRSRSVFSFSSSGDVITLCAAWKLRSEKHRD